MKNLIILFLLIAASANGSMLRWTSDHVNPDSLNEKTRPILIERLLGQLKSGDLGERSRAEDSLVSIGHPETIKNVVDRMVQGEQNTPLEHFGTGAAIPYLMDGIETASSESPEIESETGTLVLSNRGRIAYALLKIIKYTETAFPIETKDWAEYMIRYLGGPNESAGIDLIKKWWEENQSAILEKRYTDATWLPPLYRDKSSYLGAEEIKDRKTEQERLHIARRSRSESTTAQSKEFTKNTSSQKLWIILTACTLSVAGLIGWKLKTRRNREDG